MDLSLWRDIEASTIIAGLNVRKLKAFSTEKRQQNENKHKFQFNGILLESVSQQAAQGIFFISFSSYPWKMHHNFSNLFSTIYVLLRQMESNDLPFESWSCNTWDQLFLLPEKKGNAVPRTVHYATRAVRSVRAERSKEYNRI